MKTLQTKNLNKQQAKEQLIEVTSLLFELGLNFSTVYKRCENKITITSVKHCDSVAVQFTNFDIKFKNGSRYAEMIINYE